MRPSSSCPRGTEGGPVHSSGHATGAQRAREPARRGAPGERSWQPTRTERARWAALAYFVVAAAVFFRSRRIFQCCLIFICLRRCLLLLRAIGAPVARVAERRLLAEAAGGRHAQAQPPEPRGTPM